MPGDRYPDVSVLLKSIVIPASENTGQGKISITLHGIEKLVDVEITNGRVQLPSGNYDAKISAVVRALQSQITMD